MIIILVLCNPTCLSCLQQRVRGLKLEKEGGREEERGMGIKKIHHVSSFVHHTFNFKLHIYDHNCDRLWKHQIFHAKKNKAKNRLTTIFSSPVPSDIAVSCREVSTHLTSAFTPSERLKTSTVFRLFRALRKWV